MAGVAAHQVAMLSPVSPARKAPAAAGLKMWRPRQASAYFEAEASTQARATPASSASWSPWRQLAGPEKEVQQQAGDERGLRVRPHVEQRGQRPVGGVRQAKAQGQVGEHFRQPERQPAQHIEQQAVAGQDGQDPQHQPVHREPAQGGVQPGTESKCVVMASHENSAPSKPAEYSACPSE